ncbi:hypothetical protein PENTCL1PPCAC_21482, partial [Pristionchus entomophagus]
TSIMDLPNELIVEIYKYIGYPSRLKMRLNRRLNQLQLSVRDHLRELELSLCYSAIGRKRGDIDDYEGGSVLRTRMEKSVSSGAETEAKNTDVGPLQIWISSELNELHNRIIDQIVCVHANKLTFYDFSNTNFDTKETVEMARNIAHRMSRLRSMLLTIFP